MNYRSIKELSTLIAKKLYLIPHDVSIIIGIPRSGMLPASIISLYLNKPLGSLETLLNKKTFNSGKTRETNLTRSSNQIKENDVIFVVDDSIASGKSMREVKKTINELNIKNKVYFSAIYSAPKVINNIDIFFEKVSMPRMFEWNLLHHPQLKNASVDIDGVLCVDPLVSENDDGRKYKDFLINAKPKYIPNHYIDNLVTSRLEKYRSETEEWLRKYSINYGNLIMLDLPNSKSRLRYGSGKYKAEIYKKNNSEIFIESDKSQAKTIAKISGKPVICTDSQEIFYGEFLSLQNINYQQRSLIKKILTKIKVTILKVMNK